jgi:hypothetical protein
MEYDSVTNLRKLLLEERWLSIVLCGELIILTGQLLVPLLYWHKGSVLVLGMLGILAIPWLYLLSGMASGRRAAGGYYCVVALLFLFFSSVTIYGFWKYNYGPMSYSGHSLPRNGLYKIGDGAIPGFGILLLGFAYIVRVAGLGWNFIRRAVYSQNLGGGNQFARDTTAFSVLFALTLFFLLFSGGGIYYGVRISI